MANAKKAIDKEEKDGIKSPLFTGNFKRDTVISDGEKIAEISQAVFVWMVKTIKSNKK